MKNDIKCRLQDEKHKNTFTRNRKMPFYDILLMISNKQWKNTSNEYTVFERFLWETKMYKKENWYILCAIDVSKIQIQNTQKNWEVFNSEGNQYKRNTARALISDIEYSQ